MFTDSCNMNGIGFTEHEIDSVFFFKANFCKLKTHIHSFFSFSESADKLSKKLFDGSVMTTNVCFSRTTSKSISPSDGYLDINISASSHSIIIHLV